VNILGTVVNESKRIGRPLKYLLLSKQRIKSINATREKNLLIKKMMKINQEGALEIKFKIIK
jgi:hypothetical protein